MSNFNNITDPIEQNNLGVKYYRGDGVEKDYTQVVQSCKWSKMWLKPKLRFFAHS